MIDFETSREDTLTIHAIAKRAASFLNLDLLAISMDITACHLNACPLRLVDLLAADDGNLAHDIGGIARHLDRETGDLRGCFVPRFAA